MVACGCTAPETTQAMTRAGWTLLVATLIAACGPASQPDQDGVEILVSAAASLTDAFEAIKEAFEDENPEVTVLFNFGPSSGLRAQIIEGAPADVFASADRPNMEQVVDAGGVSGSARIFARNLLQIAVPAGNPAGITGLEDFARTDLLIGLCARDVPCGSFARRALEKAGVVPAVDTNETDVRALMSKIEADEVDAGITYVTDVISSEGRLEGIEIPHEYNVTADYPIAVLADAPNPQAAATFLAFVLSERGQQILQGYGFASP